MTQQKANEAIIISALVVAGIYAYRRATEPLHGETHKTHGATVRQLAQPFTGEEIPPLGRFVTGWGFTYLVVSIMGAASPGLGGYFAILIGTGAVLGNGLAISRDLSTALGKSPENKSKKGTKKHG